MDRLNKLAGKSQTSTPAKNFNKLSCDLSSITSYKTAKMSSTTGKKSTMDMVAEAITEIGVTKKGASFQAIKKYVTEKYGGDGSKMLITNLKKAVLRGLESGILSRPGSSKNAKGATGFFLLSKLGPKKPEVKKVRKKPSEPVSDSEVTVNKGQQSRVRKANLSDTEIEIGRKRQKGKMKTVPSGKSKEKSDKKPLFKPNTDKVLAKKTDKAPPKEGATFMKEKPQSTKGGSDPKEKKVRKNKLTKEKVTEEDGDKAEPKEVPKKEKKVKKKLSN